MKVIHARTGRPQLGGHGGRKEAASPQAALPESIPFGGEPLAATHHSGS